jgi:hypothetical protein
MGVVPALQFHTRHNANNEKTNERNVASKRRRGVDDELEPCLFAIFNLLLLFAIDNLWIVLELESGGLTRLEVEVDQTV